MEAAHILLELRPLHPFPAYICQTAVLGLYPPPWYKTAPYYRALGLTTLLLLECAEFSSYKGLRWVSEACISMPLQSPGTGTFSKTCTDLQPDAIFTSLLMSKEKLPMRSKAEPYIFKY